MAARQHGKSVVGNSITAVWVDEYKELFEKPDKPVEYLEFNTPPLALVIALIEQNIQLSEIVAALGQDYAVNKIDLTTVVKDKHHQQSSEILQYFAKKHTMRRLKGEWVSEYMLAIDEIVDNPKRINKEHLGILVTLPRIYEQNRTLERVMKNHKSAKKIDNLSFAAWHGEIEFVERVHVKAGRNNEYHYFFSTPKNYLMRIVVRKGDYGVGAWDTLSKLGKLHISTEAVYTYPVKGYDFNVLQPSPEQIEIKIV